MRLEALREDFACAYALDTITLPCSRLGKSRTQLGVLNQLLSQYITYECVCVCVCVYT